MFSHLNAYLLQSKQVFIPSVGTFELRYQPATLNFAERIIEPPVHIIFYLKEGSISEHQLSYLVAQLGTEQEEAEKELSRFGQALKYKIAQSDFYWNGLGQLKWIDESIVFKPEQATVLAPVAAHKIIREGATHGVLVGETERHSSDTSYIGETKASSRSYAHIIGWILVLLAALLIGYQLYKNNFHPYSSGLQKKTMSGSLDVFPEINTR